MSDDYGEDLAYIHDAGFGHIASAAGPVLIDALRRSGHESGLAFDLGCGSGILSRTLLDAGYHVRGIDISPAMVAMARKRAPGGRFNVGPIRAAALTECVAVAAIGECLNYLFDPGDSLRAIDEIFRRIHQALVPGGILLFDVAEPGRAGSNARRRGFVEGTNWAVLVESEEDSDSRILTRRITTFRQLGTLYRRGHETHRLRLIPRQSIKASLHAVGFRVRTLSAYGTLQFPKGLVGFLARKA
jgi:SAM-dependent methyltransferase